MGILAERSAALPSPPTHMIHARAHPQHTALTQTTVLFCIVLLLFSRSLYHALALSLYCR